jgi:hypothetical protein
MDKTIVKNNIFSALGILLLVAMSGLFYWTYNQLMASNESIQNSNRVYQKVLDDSLAINRANVRELKDFKERLQMTESLLAKMKEENDKLREKLVLLNKVAELESDIARLKERNSQILNQMSQMEWKSPYREQRLKSVGEAKALLAEYADKLRLVKTRIRDIKGAERQKQILALEEADKMKMVLGNNGYLVRDGKIMPAALASPAESQKVKVDVTFVK